MKLALDPQRFYATSAVHELPDVEARMGYDWMELSPKADFITEFNGRPEAPEAAEAPGRRLEPHPEQWAALDHQPAGQPGAGAPAHGGGPRRGRLRRRDKALALIGKHFGADVATAVTSTTIES